jgi:hypothetical protein
MKRLILALAIVTLLVVSVSAADVTLNGRTFTLIQYNQLYLLAFQQGPFGPGETGIATLTCNGVQPLYMNYSFEEPFCTFMLPTTGLPEITVRYILYGNELLFAPEGAANFTEQLEQ